MPEFIVRARKAPVDPERFLAAVGREGRVEYLAHMIVNALMLSKGHREDSTITLVLEDSKDFSRALTLSGAVIGDLGGSHESALLNACAAALKAARGLAKEQRISADNGIRAELTSFEHLVKARVAQGPVYMLDRKGADVRDTDFAPDSVFLLTDHIPMPKKTFNSLARQGVQKISLGPRMLHGSQCITLIHNELDRQFAL